MVDDAAAEPRARVTYQYTCDKFTTLHRSALQALEGNLKIARKEYARHITALKPSIEVSSG